MPPPQPNAIGRYAIVEQLGQGGMGVVYRAWDPELRRMVAVKVISGSGEEPVGDQVFERFAREARSAASLAHPNIVTVHDFGRDAGKHPFIVMELVDGQSMAQIVREARSLPLGRRVRLMAELCEGLAYAHGRGVIHRDIKPANLMITSSGVLKILDFGLARLTNDLADGGLTQVGAVIGTPRYMAPEQIRGVPADARSDIYSVGTVMYELFTGHAASGGFEAGLGRHLLGDRRPIDEAVPGFPESLAALVTRATEREASRRYQSLDQLAAELRTWERDFGGTDGSARGALSVGPDSDSDETQVSGLDDILGQWENAVGRALATPAERAVSGPTSRASDSQSSPRTVAPARPAPRSGRLSAATLVMLALLAVLAAAGLYLALHPGLLTAWRAAPAPETSVPPSERTEPVAPGAGNGNEQRPVRPSGTAAPGATAVAPRAGVADREEQSRLAARCTEILERVGIGEELTAADRVFLAEQCRNRSR